MSLRPTALFIDLDGTIMVNPFGREVFPRVMGMLAQACGKPAEELLREVVAENERRQHDPNAPSAAWVMDWDDILQTVAGRYGVPHDTIPADSCERLARQFATPPHTATLDDAVTHLMAIRAASHRRLAVSTMGLHKYQRPVLDALGLSACFDHFLTPDTTGCLKTERDFFRQVTDSLRLDARYISVGDNFMHDVFYPHKYGFHSVLRLPEPALEAWSPFERPAHIAAHSARIQYYPSDPAATEGILPDAVITHLRELPAVIDVLERG